MGLLAQRLITAPRFAFGYKGRLVQCPLHDGGLRCKTDALFLAPLSNAIRPVLYEYMQPGSPWFLLFAHVSMPATAPWTCCTALHLACRDCWFAMTRESWIPSRWLGSGNSVTNALIFGTPLEGASQRRFGHCLESLSSFPRSLARGSRLVQYTISTQNADDSKTPVHRLPSALHRLLRWLGDPCLGHEIIPFARPPRERRAVQIASSLKPPSQRASEHLRCEQPANTSCPPP